METEDLPITEKPIERFAEPSSRLRSSSAKASPAKPFLKWVGGKTQLLPAIVERLPRSFNRFHEPFLGGGAVFFRIDELSRIPNDGTTRIFLSDVNSELINTYRVVRDQVEDLIEHLKVHRYEKEYYYSLRALDRTLGYKALSDLERASRIIFLNKTCFNGLYRVSAQGFFNTPFGRYKNPRIVDPENLRNCSRALQNVEILLEDFQGLEERVERGDFVYFDPPYVPLSETSSFTSYASVGFEMAMQEKLFQLCEDLDRKGVSFLLSNSSHPWVRERYRSFSVEPVQARRAINSKADKRGEIHEVLIRNYPV